LIFIYRFISVNTDITDNMNESQKSCVCYDADCPVCVRWAERCRALLQTRGFAVLPLQSPEIREVLQVPDGVLLAEMRVITNGGQVFGGADALVYLSNRLCKPLFWLSCLPGTKPLLRSAYRFIAHHRSCATGACRTTPRKSFHVENPADWLPIPILVVAAVAVGRQFPPWLYMWTLAFTLFAGCKWFCFRRDLAKVQTISLGKKLAFLFGWVGMNAGFLKPKRTEAPRTIEWIFAALKIALGAILLWVFTPRAIAINPLLAGWNGMTGVVLLLHFGLFQMLWLGWRAAGFNPEPLMRAPLLSRSVGEFWGNRWNTAFNALAARFLFHPLRRRIGIPLVTMLVFLVSGLVHDLILSVPARGGYGLPTLYFLLQGAVVLFERTAFARKLQLNRGFRGRLFTIGVVAGPAFWLFHPVFIQNAMLPFLRRLGAI